MERKIPRYYLDHASTSFPKPAAVWEAFERQARVVGAPAGRSSYGRATETDAAIERARIGLARFFGAPPDRVIFTLNATDALNMALKGVVTTGDHVVTSVMEHNSVLRPLSALEATGVKVTRIGTDADGTIDPDDVRDAINSATRLVAVTHASNVTGTLQPIKEIAHVARERGVAVLVDAAQTAGTLPISLADDGIDLLAVPGHKGLLGPPGTGALLFSESVDVAPLREGGTGFRSEETTQPDGYPQRLESGSPNTPGIVGLGAAIKELESRGLDAVRSHLEHLMRRVQEGLDSIPGLRWFGPHELLRREPVYSVLLDGYSPGELATILDSSFGVETRAGLHCAPCAHQAIGTFPQGTCRLSLGAPSSETDVDAALAALEAIAGDG